MGFIKRSRMGEQGKKKKGLGTPARQALKTIGL